MKNLRVLPLCLVFLSAIVFTEIASAQPAETNALEWQQISIKNIRPSILAYWIDPAHFPKPAEYIKADGYMRELLPKSAQDSSQKVPLENNTSANVFGKPIGTTIFADDANKVIWVRGTQTQFDQIKPIVDFLDRPIRQIDFDIKIMELVSHDASITANDPMLGMIFQPSARRGNTFLSTHLESTLTDLIENGDIKIVKSTQMTISNNLTERYSTTTSTPVTVDIKDADSQTQLLTTQSDSNNPLFMEKRFSLVLTPTINNDDTITIFNTAAASAELTHKTSAKDDQFWIQNLDQQKVMTTVFTMKNGSSMLFTGFNSTSLGLDNENNPIVLWVKAEIEK